MNSPFKKAVKITPIGVKTQIITEEHAYKDPYYTTWQTLQDANGRQIGLLFLGETYSLAAAIDLHESVVNDVKTALKG